VNTPFPRVTVSPRLKGGIVEEFSTYRGCPK